jgi:two-component system OmpR family response regulator
MAPEIPSVAMPVVIERTRRCPALRLVTLGRMSSLLSTSGAILVGDSSLNRDRRRSGGVLGNLCVGYEPAPDMTRSTMRTVAGSATLELRATTEESQRFGGNLGATMESVTTTADAFGTKEPRPRDTTTHLVRADGSPLRALVVDDEQSLAEVLASVLRIEGWTAEAAHMGSSAVRAAERLKPDAVILDMMLPDFDGLEVLRRIRAVDPHVCVLFLTARDSVDDRIAGIKAGGDDYVAKPFSLEEVLARVRGLVRRAGIARSMAESVLEVGDLVMDEDAREVHRGGERIELTATEFELLRFLMLHPRRVMSKAQILDRVWQYDFGGQAHVVELYISYLRKKIDAGREPMIHTVRGFGYVLRPPP